MPATLHLAGPPHNAVQRCTRCRLTLIDNTNSWSSDGKFGYYPEGPVAVYPGNPSIRVATPDDAPPTGVPPCTPTSPES